MITFNDFVAACSIQLNPTEVKKMLERGYDPNVENTKGCTPLMFAVMPNEYGDHNGLKAVEKVVDILLMHSADKTKKDSFGKTAYDYALAYLDPNWFDEFGDNVIDTLSKEDELVVRRILQKLQ